MQLLRRFYTQAYLMAELMVPSGAPITNYNFIVLLGLRLLADYTRNVVHFVQLGQPFER